MLFLSMQSQGGEYGKTGNQSQSGKWQSELQTDRRRWLDEHLSARHLCRNHHDDRTVCGDRLLEKIRRLGEPDQRRSEEHTSELQSPDHLVCRLLLEKKKQFLKT